MTREAVEQAKAALIEAIAVALANKYPSTFGGSYAAPREVASCALDAALAAGCLLPETLEAEIAWHEERAAWHAMPASAMNAWREGAITVHRDAARRLRVFILRGANDAD